MQRPGGIARRRRPAEASGIKSDPRDAMFNAVRHEMDLRVLPKPRPPKGE
jgi:hypothetical protein